MVGLKVKPKTYNIGICYFSTKSKNEELRSNSKDWLGRNQDVHKWGYMSITGLLFQWASTIKLQLIRWFSTKRTA